MNRLISISLASVGKPVTSTSVGVSCLWACSFLSRSARSSAACRAALSSASSFLILSISSDADSRRTRSDRPIGVMLGTATGAGTEAVVGFGANETEVDAAATIVLAGAAGAVNDEVLCAPIFGDGLALARAEDVPSTIRTPGSNLLGTAADLEGTDAGASRPTSAGWDEDPQDDDGNGSGSRLITAGAEGRGAVLAGARIGIGSLGSAKLGILLGSGGGEAARRAPAFVGAGKDASGTATEVPDGAVTG